MGHITDGHVSAVNDRIAQAETGHQAFRVIDGLTRTMVDRVLDLNGIGSDNLHGIGIDTRRTMIAEGHGWVRGQDRPADHR